MKTVKKFMKVVKKQLNINSEEVFVSFKPDGEGYYVSLMGEDGLIEEQVFNTKEWNCIRHELDNLGVEILTAK